MSVLLGSNISRQASELWNKSKHYSRNLNFFPSAASSTDEHELRTQRITTRLFIFLWILSMTILLLYTSLIKVTKTIDVEEPSLVQYSQLNSTYSQTLICPCSKISINYDRFLYVEYTLHQVCSSPFVNQSWIDYLIHFTESNRPKEDFRRTSAYAFQALRIFCELINRTISDSLIQFYSNQYVSASVISQRLFESETKSFINQFRSSLTNRFLLSLAMIGDTTQVNALFSGLQTNYEQSVINDSYNIDINVVTYMECSCASSSTCIQPSSISNYTHPTVLFYVPGFYTGCYVIESLLQSNLECFYSQQCINKLQGYLSPSSSMNVIALDASLSSVYSIHSTIKELVDNLMIEQWNASMMYERYYTECQPTQCTYTLQRRNDVIYIFTTLFGIAGGITTILQIILPPLVKFLRRKKEQGQPNSGKIKPKEF